MRVTTRLLATVGRSGTYLTPFEATGLTGVVTHPSPRPYLIYVYNKTLDKLKQFPESSVYRQSVEALTKQRLTIVQSYEPEGLQEWRDRMKQKIAANPQIFGPLGHAKKSQIGDELYIVTRKRIESETSDERVLEYDGEEKLRAKQEGIASAEERAKQDEEFGAGRELPEIFGQEIGIEEEPPLTAQQVNDIETKIGAGLIEEIIAVAESEDNLVDEMLSSKVWEDLEEKPVPGQWEYFERDAPPEAKKPA